MNSNAKGTLDDLRTEAKKCVLLCRNCHSELHNPKMMSALFIAPPSAIQPMPTAPVIPMKKQHEDYIIALRSDWISHRSIARMCHVKESVVYRICKKAGLNIGSERYKSWLEDFCERYKLPDLPYMPK